ncbi:serine carboxypeptidase [Punctularia strigosozonata HHB-11173 SS5]|uniref:serine carboxypeptidase n=1 Tax=Punctularia strigosozonata (strain HHB-11173) TaxID=741275 RepID=UPI0004417199|nr:serine carboxypeptidase [Punctularia strigosozonata HHB-11173 SS5]EIN14318.1 serine carboxypeptidase [Punctularia strigosozonata HHB-11173 SS5]
MTRALLLLPLLSVGIHAVPTVPGEVQTVLSDLAAYSNLAASVFGSVADGIEHLVHDALDGAKDFLGKEKVGIYEWAYGAGGQFVHQDGMTYELVAHPAFAEHSLRFTEPDICDSTVKQYSGYLDITDGKHLFFWFFEARNNPGEGPLILWLNGGPGCSSSTGLLFELGPCNIADEGKNTTYNEFGWNTHANIIFLDQPINVGYSYSDDGSTVNTSPVAGKDVYAFLELFLARFPKYASLPFHIAAESYGGTYAPNIASVIHQANKALATMGTRSPVPGDIRINLASVILANGLTNPLIQMASVPDYACEGPFAIFEPDGPQCQSLRSKVPTCERLIQSCYDYNSRFTCVPAALYCWSQLFGPLQQTGLNLYDVRKKCDKSKDGDLCYKEMTWIDTWMNTDANKRALGVNPDLKFQSCNMEVNQAFMFQGDGMHNSADLLPELVNDGIRLLVYAGNADAMCNFMGNERWVSQLDTEFHEEFLGAQSLPWVTEKSGQLAGAVRSAGGKGYTAGNVTFLNVYDAGHMVPYDQSEAALDMITRWLKDVPLSL